MSIDELLPEARDLKRELGGLPSKDAIRKALKVRWDRASEVHRQLSVEDVQESRGARAALRKLAERKNPRRPVRPARRPLPAVSPAAVIELIREPDIGSAEAVREEVQPVEAEVFPKSSRKVATWPLQLIALPAYVAIWAGWVALGGLTGFGPINLLPGFTHDGDPLLVVNTAITLPIGAEAYATYALYVLFHSAAPVRARKFAAWSALAALLIGMGGQVAYHLMAADGMTAAPWEITTAVSCLPVAVLGAAAALVHLVRAGEVKS
jgi:hypothetical protein